MLVCEYLYDNPVGGTREGGHTSFEQLVHLMPSLRVIPCAFPKLMPHHPGFVELVYDTPAPTATPQPAHLKRRRLCEATTLQRRRKRMLAPWVLASAPRRGL